MKNTNISSKCEISKTSIIFDNVEIEDNVKISDYCLIGYNPKKNNKKLIIRKNTIINSHTTIYSDSEIGENNLKIHIRINEIFFF